VVSEKVYRVALTLGVPVDGAITQAFAALPGVANVTTEDHTLQFIVRGALDPLIKQASQYPVISLTSHEPTLEEAFLAYYRPAAPPDPAQATPEQDAGHAA
jgi:ABC-2 type transport system ATP-binding protein